MIKYVVEKEFKNEIGNSKVLVDFFATWCGPCKMLGNVLEKFSKNNDIDIIKVDVDEASNLSSEYKIYSVPTLILFENGSEIKRISGFMTEDELNKWVND